MINNKFVFVIPFFNCQDQIEKTIFSLLSQSYANWSAILINDLSTDDTLNIAINLCNSLPEQHRKKFKFINNKEKHGEVRNTLQAIEFINNDDVVCRVDGGDWLIDNDVLHYLNKAYQDPDIAVAWTAQRWGYTLYNISGPLDLTKYKSVYDHPWVSSHMKTFKCSYLKQVPNKNFLDDEGNYIMIACDQAIFLPMMHMAALKNKKLMFLPLQAYHYNIDVYDKNLHKTDRAQKQKMSAETIRARGYIE